MTSTLPNILSIAGSDPSGGAGIQADLKSIAANGGYGMAAITALTAQNTTGVTGVHTPPAAFLRQQLETLVADVQIDAIKVGMLGSVEVVTTVHDFLRHCPDIPVVVDPVMVATSGSKLLDDEAVVAVSQLTSLADLATPNIPEALVLAGRDQTTPIPDDQDVDELAQGLSAKLGVPVLVKGGHSADSHQCRDVLAHDGQLSEFISRRVETANTHGTGCSLSSAIATHRGFGSGLCEAVSRAKDWLTGTLTHADRLQVGRGPGPVHHTHEWH